MCFGHGNRRRQRSRVDEAAKYGHGKKKNTMMDERKRGEFRIERKITKPPLTESFIPRFYYLL